MGTGEAQHGSLIRAILSAVVGCCAAWPLIFCRRSDHSRPAVRQSGILVLPDLVRRGPGRFLQASLYSLALSISHKATFSILKSIREKILEKLPKMPLGTILIPPAAR